MNMKQTSNIDFLLNVFERFGKSNAQAAIDFVRKNQTEAAEKKETVTVCLSDPNTFEDLDGLKAIIGNGFKETSEFAKRLNNFYIRAYCAGDMEEKDLELVEYYSSAFLTIVDAKRKVLGEKRVSEFQSVPFEAIDLELPSGKMWANMNVGADAPDEPGMYFNHYDACELEFEDGWQLPTEDDFVELDNNCDHEYIEVNGIKGMKFTSKKNGNSVFFPCSGYGNGSSWNNRGSYGHYWSGSLSSATGGRYLLFYSGGVNPQYDNSRFLGFAVRAFQ